MESVLQLVASRPLLFGVGTVAVTYFLFSLLWRKTVNVRDKHILISGASTGLGFAFAQLLARKGAKITIASANPKRLEEAREMLQAISSHSVLALQCDVRNPDQVAAVVQQAVAKQGAIDWVVPCAGAAAPGYFDELTPQTFADQINLNYLGSAYLVKAALPHLKRGSRVVFVSSGAGCIGFVGYSAYSPSKYAVRALAECLRNELLHSDIRVHLYLPSSMYTPGFEVEEKSKPAECRTIEGSAGYVMPDVAAQTLLNGIAAENFAITIDAPSWVLRSSTNGVPPRTSPLLEVVLLPFMGLFGIVFRLYMDWVVTHGPKAAQLKKK